VFLCFENKILQQYNITTQAIVVKNKASKVNEYMAILYSNLDIKKSATSLLTITSRLRILFM